MIRDKLLIRLVKYQRRKLQQEANRHHDLPPRPRDGNLSGCILL